MKIYSSEFPENGSIPSRFTCDGEQFLSPHLYIEDVPETAVSLALIMDDPDVPEEIRADKLFVHWVLFNIPPKTREIPEGDTAGTTGANTRGDLTYTGPCPPPEYEPSEHRYFFKLFALDTMLDFPEGANAQDIEEAMTGHLIEKAEYVGVYKRTEQLSSD